MVDQGGTNYNFNIGGDFLAKMAELRRLAEAAKAELEQLRAERSKKGKSSGRTRKEEDSEGRLARKKAAALKSLSDQTNLLADADVRAAKAARDRAAAQAKAEGPQAQQAAERKAAKEREKLQLQEQRRKEKLAKDDAKRADDADKLTRKLKAEEERAAKQRERDANREAKQRENQAHRARVLAERARADAVRFRNQQIAEARDQRKFGVLTDPALRAGEQNNRQVLNREVLQQRIQQQRTQASLALRSGDIAGFRQAQVEVAKLSRALQKTERDGNSLLFTFRRLVGVLAVFTLARNAVQGIQDLISAGLKFNDQVQNSTTGIAGLVSALADVRNAEGQTVSASEEFSLALGLAEEQVAALRQESLRTVATFEQLLDTFQVSLGPGLAAGLNLDQVRQLTVGISQAASALGVPQNQLAEEVRSLLSGTIQARTTRIATVLGISNTDIKNLKESGRLFDGLRDRLEAFNLAAERQARTSLSGISTLIKGALNEALGAASAGLFDALIERANAFFDTIVTIRDEFGNLRPNPDFVNAFQPIFESLTRLLGDLSEAFSGRGALSSQQSDLQRLRTIIAAVAGTLEVAARFAAGFANQVISFISAITRGIQATASFFGITVQQVGKLAAGLGIVVASIFALNKAAGLTFDILIKIRAAAAGIAAFSRGGLAKGFLLALVPAAKFLLIVSGVVSAIELILKGINFIFGTNLSLLDKLASAAQGIRNGLFGAKGQAEALTAESRSLLDVERQINQAVQERVAAGDTFGAAFDPDKKFVKRGSPTAQAQGGGGPILSTSERVITDSAKAITELAVAASEAQKAFAFLQGTVQEGFAGELQKLSIDSLIKEEERLLKLNQERLSLQDRFRKAVFAGRTGLAESIQSSLESVRKALGSANDESLRLRAAEAAQLAAQRLPALERENQLAQARLLAEQQIAAAKGQNLSKSQLAVVEATNALNLAQAQARVEQTALAKEIEGAEREAALLPAGAERDAVFETIKALREKLLVEKGISDEKAKQLERERQEAQLVATGTTAQGSRQGFIELQDDLPTRFEAGVNAMKGTVQSFTSFLSSSIVEAFDPTNETSLSEKFARFFQDIAQLFLQEFLKAQLQAQAARFATGAIGGAHSGGIVRARGFNKGGMAHHSRRVQGLRKGGRPAHIHPKDTVPAWLQPGEFVVREKVVRALGVDFFDSINGGKFDVAASATAGAASPAMGMAAGGAVAERPVSAAGGLGVASGGGTEVRVVPAVVARDREMDTLLRGGAYGHMAFMRENATEINRMLDKGPRRR